jgi:hypothetical protein
MSADDVVVKAPDNVNPLYLDKFKFAVKRLPATSFWCVSGNIPGVTQTPIAVPTMHNPIKVGGNKLQYEELTVGFRVDEDLKNWKELYDWIRGITAPENAQQFKDLVETNALVSNTGYKPVFSDGTLMTLSNTTNFNVELTFKDLMPVTLSSIQMDQTTTGQTIVATASFIYQSYDIDIL